MGIFDYAREDGCGGIHSEDMGTVIDRGDVEKGSDGFWHDDHGNTYGDDGRHY